MRRGSLLTLKVIKCLTCYDLGETVDPEDHGKRTRCECQPAEPKRWLCPCLLVGKDGKRYGNHSGHVI